MTRVAPRPVPSEAPPAEIVHLAPGTRLGRYELLYPIASGGMARVWAAEQIGDLGFRRVVALKTILPDFALDGSFQSMFLDEAKLASQIHHVNVVEVLDLGASGHLVYQAMTFIEGATLSSWLSQGPGHQPTVGAGIRIVADVLRGLHAAHELCDENGTHLGLVHRDVSPQNILIGVDGVAKLADFGIAKAFRRVTDETKAGAVKGKIAYMAPELLDGESASPQSDLFSAGVVLWEVITGQRLFPRTATGTTTQSKRRRIPIRDPRELVPDLPDELVAVVLRALERDPDDRYRTSLEMADTLEEVARTLGIDATARHVAARLEIDLGETIRAQRETIRSVRRVKSDPSGFGLLVTPTGPLAPMSPAMAPVAATVALPKPTTTGRARSRQKAIGAIATFGALGILLAFVMLRAATPSAGASSIESPPPPAAPSSVFVAETPPSAPAITPAAMPSALPSASPAAPVRRATQTLPTAGANRGGRHSTTAPSAPAAASAPKPRFESPY